MVGKASENYFLNYYIFDKVILGRSYPPKSKVVIPIESRIVPVVVSSVVFLIEEVSSGVAGASKSFLYLWSDSLIVVVVSSIIVMVLSSDASSTSQNG